MKHADKLDLISNINEKIIERNSRKRASLWHKTEVERNRGRGKNLTIILLTAALVAVTTAFAIFVILNMTDDPTPPDPGREIVSIEKTSTEGHTAIYTITYRDGTAFVTVTDKAPDGSGAKVTGLSFDEAGDIYLSLASGKLLNMGRAVGSSRTPSPTLRTGGMGALTLTVTPPLMLLGETDEAIGIAGVTVSEEEVLSYELNNGKHLALGHVHKKTEGKDTTLNRASINEAGELILGFASGETVNLGRVVGKDGKDGVGIAGITLSEKGELSVSLTNGTVLNLGNVKGKDGIGIAQSKINDGGELVLTYTDGNSVNLGRVVGERGEDGVGIASINITDAGELTIVLTDGTNLNLGVIKGQDGKSAYELYKEKYGYEGTEEEWLFDLVNGNLATKIKYPVTFDSAGGSEVPAQEIEEGGKVMEPEPPTRAGYTFLGWYYGEELWSFAGYSVTEAITLTAKWEIVTYTIRYEKVYPTNTEMRKVSYTVNDEITVRNLSYYLGDNGVSLTGRSFLGWTYGDVTTPTKDLAIPKGTTGNLVVTAHWDVQETFQFTAPPVDNRKDVETYDQGAFFAYTAPSSKVYAVCDGVVKSLKQEGDTYTLVLTLDYDLSGKKAVTYKGIGTLAEGIARDAFVSAGDVLGQTIDSSLAYIHLTFNGSGKDCTSYFSAQALERIQMAENTYGKHLILSAENICGCLVGNNVQATVQNGCATVTYDKQDESYPHPHPVFINGNSNELNFQPAYLVIRYRTERQHNATVIITSEQLPDPQGLIPVDWNNDGEWDTVVLDVSNHVAQPFIGFFSIDLQDAGNLSEIDEEPIEFAYIGFFDTQESAQTFAEDFSNR